VLSCHPQPLPRPCRCTGGPQGPVLAGAGPQYLVSSGGPGMSSVPGMGLGTSMHIGGGMGVGMGMGTPGVYQQVYYQGIPQVYFQPLGGAGHMPVLVHGQGSGAGAGAGAGAVPGYECCPTGDGCAGGCLRACVGPARGHSPRMPSAGAPLPTGREQ